jgi:hypothetical protein
LQTPERETPREGQGNLEKEQAEKQESTHTISEDSKETFEALKCIKTA